MKIFIIPVPPKLQPTSQIITYPHHNKDYGVEQDFLDWLINKKQNCLVERPELADWHYLPVFWTRWHINHEYGLYGISELQKEVDQLIIDENKTFTICQYDDGPVVDLGKSLIFLSSRKNYNGIDIPLLSSPHKKPFIKPSKKYLCSFVGRKSTHPIREIMFQQLNRGDVFLYDGDNGSRFFVKKTLESYISLCPRGYGGSSFRFFESMQLGIVPFLIGDIDTRPFKRFINWDEISFFSDSITSLIEKLDCVEKSKLIEMGKNAERTWKEQITFQKWCDHVFKELIEL